MSTDFQGIFLCYSYLRCKRMIFCLRWIFLCRDRNGSSTSYYRKVANKECPGKQQKAVAPFRITAFLFRNAASLCLRVFFLQLGQRCVFVRHVFVGKNRCDHQVRVDELHGRIKGKADCWRVDDAKQGQSGPRRTSDCAPQRLVCNRKDRDAPQTMLLMAITFAFCSTRGST